MCVLQGSGHNFRPTRGAAVDQSHHGEREHRIVRGDGDMRHHPNGILFQHHIAAGQKLACDVHGLPEQAARVVTQVQDHRGGAVVPYGPEGGPEVLARPLAEHRNAHMIHRRARHPVPGHGMKPDARPH